MKEIKDLISYLKQIDKMAEPLPTIKKSQLGTIMRSIITLLVCLRQQSGLGEIDFNWKDL